MSVGTPVQLSMKQGEEKTVKCTYTQGGASIDVSKSGVVTGFISDNPFADREEHTNITTRDTLELINAISWS